MLHIIYKKQAYGGTNMNDYNIYEDIAVRSGGDVYIGVVGPVRTGKSTFIKRFMETLVLPNIIAEGAKQRATDEMPQSAAGKTVMTTEPKFIPDEAVQINLDGNASFKVKMIDCVGYVVPGAMGTTEEGQPRMVLTPWSDKEMPFDMAAEIGTKKVISEHSNIGVLVTTDGTVSDLPRENYIAAEKRVVDELKAMGKPFVIVLNSAEPATAEAISLAMSLEEEYGVPVALVNCTELDGEDIRKILELVLTEFPIGEIVIEMPKWIDSLDDSHLLKKQLYDRLIKSADGIEKVGEVQPVFGSITDNDFGLTVSSDHTDLATGSCHLKVNTPEKLFYRILGEETGFTLDGEESLMGILSELSHMKREYDRLSQAIAQVNATGYGIVTPSVEDLTLEEPEIVRQNGGYGVKLRASAPSIHMIRANIETEVSPIVGSEKQSEDMVKFLLKEFEEDPTKIWESNMFGKSLHELVNEGLNAKLSHMPDEARLKLAETLQRIINEGSGGLICILL